MNRALAVLLVIVTAAACRGRDAGTTAPPDTTIDTTHTPPPPPPPPRVASVDLTPGYSSVPAGSTVQMQATPRDSTGAAMNAFVGWTTSDAAVARVSASGVVTAVAPGVSVVTAISEGKTATASVSVPIPAGSGAVQHVFMVLEENTEYGAVLGNPNMPYLNALAKQYGLATAYYADTHPSIGNYMMLTTGSVITNDDSYADTVTADNVVRRLLAAGRTWKSYAEHIPNAGYTGGNSGEYVKHHNPFAYFSDVLNSPAQTANLVPFTQLAADMSAGKLPNYGFVVPNVCSDGHNCSLSTVDGWLATNIGPLLRDPVFRSSGLLIITFDEGATSINGGGRVAWVVIGARARRGFTSATQFEHASTCRLTLDLLGVTGPGPCAAAVSMSGLLTP